MGNVIEENLQTILDSDPFTDLSYLGVDTNPKCRMCKVRYLCGGACRAWGGPVSQSDLNVAPQECDGLQTRAKRLLDCALAYLELQGSVRISYV